MKSLLLNIPGSCYHDSPIMGLAALLGELKQQGFEDTFQRDLDLELFHYCLESRNLEADSKDLKKRKTEGSLGGGFLRRAATFLLGPMVRRYLHRSAHKKKEFIDAFRSATPLDQHFPEAGLKKYKKAIACVHRLMAFHYYPFMSYPRFFSYLGKKLFHRYVMGMAESMCDRKPHGLHALKAFYRNRLLPQIRSENFDVIGISVSFKHQLEPALALIDLLKEEGIQAKIVLGGSFITTVIDAERFDRSILKRADYIICYEGEAGLPALLRCLESGESLEEVPNLLRYQDGRWVVNKKKSIQDVSALATPDFSQVDLSLYLDRPIRLPLILCRGCYWGKCTYCSHHWTLGTGRLRIRNPDKLVQDFKTFEEKYGVRDIYFMDEAIYPETIEAVSRKLLEENLKFRWAGFFRFEKEVTFEYLKLLRDAGCHALLFGLESVSQHVQDIINKGIDVDNAMRILKDCKTLGIRAHIFVILGIPGEGEVDSLANVDFLLNNTDLYETVQIAPFQLLKGSPMFRRPERFGIRNIQLLNKGNRDAFSEYAFETDVGLLAHETNELVSNLLKNKSLFQRDFWEGHAYRLFRLSRPFHASFSAHPPEKSGINAENPRQKKNDETEFLIPPKIVG